MLSCGCKGLPHAAAEARSRADAHEARASGRDAGSTGAITSGALQMQLAAAGSASTRTLTLPQPRLPSTLMLRCSLPPSCYTPAALMLSLPSCLFLPFPPLLLSPTAQSLQLLARRPVAALPLQQLELAAPPLLPLPLPLRLPGRRIRTPAPDRHTTT